MTAPPSAVAAAMQRAITTLQQLSSTQLEDLAQGRAELVFRSAEESRPEGAVASERVMSGTDDAVEHPARHVHVPERHRGPRARPRVHADADPEVVAAAGAIRAMSTPAEVAAYLQENDRRFTTPRLREVARVLGPTVSATVRSKAELKRNIIAGTAGFRTRSAAMSGGAWSARS